MAEKKLVTCENCYSEIDGNEKVCPFCGEKVRKPVYQQGWIKFVAIFFVIIVLAVIFKSQITNMGSILEHGVKIEEEEGNAGQWEGMVLGDKLPDPGAFEVKILSEDKYGFYVKIPDVTEEEYKDYREDCITRGYTIEAEEKGFFYKAFNQEGYDLLMFFDEEKEIIELQLTAPRELETLQWPDKGLGTLLPKPKAKKGDLLADSSQSFYVYIGENPEEEYKIYVDRCIERGFPQDTYRSERDFSGKDKDGNRVYATYVGNKVVFLSLKKRKNKLA